MSLKQDQSRPFSFISLMALKKLKKRLKTRQQLKEMSRLGGRLVLQVRG